MCQLRDFSSTGAAPETRPVGEPQDGGAGSAGASATERRADRRLDESARAPPTANRGRGPRGKRGFPRATRRRRAPRASRARPSRARRARPGARSAARRAARRPPRAGRARARRADLLDPLAQLVVADRPHQPVREQRDDLVVGALGVRARGHRPARRTSSPTARAARWDRRRGDASRAASKPGPGAGEHRGDEHEQLVDEVGLEERRRERRAALEQQRLDALARRARAARRPAGRSAARAPTPSGSGPRPNASRRGWPRGVGTSRASSRGASARTVPIPTATASEARAQLVDEPPRLSSPDTHRSPGTATRPSSVTATL